MVADDMSNSYIGTSDGNNGYIPVCDDKKDVTIRTDGNITFSSNEGFGALVTLANVEEGLDTFTFTLEGKNIIFQGTQKPLKFASYDISSPIYMLSVAKPSAIYGNLSLNNAALVVGKDGMELVGSQIYGDGYLYVQGNTEISNTLVGVFGGKIYTTGITTIKDTTFALYDKDSYGFAHLLDSAGGINIGSGNDVKVGVIAYMGDYLESDSLLNCAGNLSAPMWCSANLGYDSLTNKLFEYTLKAENGALYAIGEVSEIVKQMGMNEVKKYAEIEIMENLKIYADEQAQCYENGTCTIESSSNAPTKEQVAQAYKDLSTKLQAQIEQYTNDLQASGVDSVVGAATSSAQSTQEQILHSLKNSSLQTAAVDYLTDFIYQDGYKSTQLANDIESSVQANAHNAITQAITLSNDMHIATRLAKWSNPYRDFRLTRNLAKMYLADALDSKNGINPAYLSRYAYENSVWLNVFGGFNNLGGKNGGVYGISAGYDNKLGEHTLLGGYISYALAQLNNANLAQNTQNIQAGIYTRSTFGRNEIDANMRYQSGFINQTRTIANTNNTAAYMNSFVSASLNYGYIFGKTSVFIKPLVGVNIYYLHTPQYTESGGLAQEVQAKNDMYASVNVGLDMRKYFSNGSFVYILPQVEQYILGSDGFYVASFVGSNTSFHLAGNEGLRTYGSLLVGGDIVIREIWSVNLGAGFKHSLVGIQGEKETYLSGNLGVKLRF